MIVYVVYDKSPRIYAVFKSTKSAEEFRQIYKRDTMIEKRELL